jgi:nitrogen-specific signal transduction histidine kinase
MENGLTGFRVDLRLLLELGERLISRDEVAIVELVKNAYDADAEEVNISMDQSRIEIDDDGYGMNNNELLEGWLTIGSSIKQDKRKTPKGRVVLGEKGLGRLAILRLGNKITLYTQKKSEICLKLSMDWGEIKNRIRNSKKYSPLEKIEIKIEDASALYNFSKGQGTKIIIENVNEPWSEEKVDKLKTFLSKLIDPRFDKAELYEQESTTKNIEIVKKKHEKLGFGINFNYEGQKITLEPPEITKKPHYRFQVNVADDGNYEIQINWNLDTGAGESIIKGTLTSWKLRDGKTVIWNTDPKEGCGGFSFKISAWDLDAQELKASKRDLRKWAGLSLVRDNFRVVQPDVDWLGLNMRRVQAPTMRLSSNQMIGAVYVSSDNPQLIDKTDREGLIENEGFALLKESVFFLLSKCERKRFELRHDKTLTKGKGNISQYFDNSSLKILAKNLPEPFRTEFDSVVKERENTKLILEEWALGRDRMATMGLLGAGFVHEGKSALALINDTYPLIRNSLDDIPMHLQDKIKTMVEGGRLLNQLFNEFSPFIRFQQKQIREVRLLKTIESLEFLFGKKLNESGIIIQKNVSDKIYVRANTTDIYIVLSNIVDNAIFWLDTVKKPEKIIEIRVHEDSEKVTIEIADNGPGIDEDAEIIFSTGFSTKPDGFGLGLSIVKDIVEFYGGSIIAGDDEKLGGAVFIIELPFKGAKNDRIEKN